MGIALLITPWNYPAAMATRKIAPALAAGCTVVLKPATETPLTAFAVAQIMHDCGVPAWCGECGHHRQGQRACPRRCCTIRGCARFPSPARPQVGRALLHEAADQVISCAMELGGNAPFIVCKDANLNDALDGAMLAKMRNSGEACTAANRFYVHKDIYKPFTDGIVSACRDQAGRSHRSGIHLGPMVNEKSVAKIAELVDDAIAKGAKLLLGGQRLNRPGYYYPPTVLADVPDNADMIKEEIFGPVCRCNPSRTKPKPSAKPTTPNMAWRLMSIPRTSSAACRSARSSKPACWASIAVSCRTRRRRSAASRQSGLGREGSHHGLIEFCEASTSRSIW
jgi:succinate-semialdehyde dehydrogenase/glutarate-semialdehyde dehydrogenase